MSVDGKKRSAFPGEGRDTGGGTGEKEKKCEDGPVRV